MSDTPRTDKVIQDGVESDVEQNADDLLHYMKSAGRLADFARTLERELNAITDTLDSFGRTHPDALSAARAAMREFNEVRLKQASLERENARLREALEDCANPMRVLDREAEKSGARVDGMGAYLFINDANQISKIARDALAALSESA